VNAGKLKGMKAGKYKGSKARRSKSLKARELRACRSKNDFELEEKGCYWRNKSNKL